MVGLTAEQIKELKKQKRREELGSEFGSSYEESDSEDDDPNLVFEDDIQPLADAAAAASHKKEDFPQKGELHQKFERGTDQQISSLLNPALSLPSSLVPLQG